MTLRVLVCGGREYTDRERIYAVLDRFRARFGVAMVIHGGQTGADALAGDWAAERCLPCLCVPADWAALGKRAGPERNARMLALGKPDKVLAFPGGFGTGNMMARAKDAGVEVMEIPARPSSP